jgi:hypothetical protein
VHRADDDRHPRLPRDVGDLARFVLAHREWLLAEDRLLARAAGRDDLLGMEAVGTADDHHLDRRVGDDISRIEAPGGVHATRDRGGHVGVDVHHVHDGEAGYALERGKVDGLGNGAAAEYPHTGGRTHRFSPLRTDAALSGIGRSTEATTKVYSRALFASQPHVVKSDPCYKSA